MRSHLLPLRAGNLQKTMNLHGTHRSVPQVHRTLIPGLVLLPALAQVQEQYVFRIRLVPLMSMCWLPVPRVLLLWIDVLFQGRQGGCLRARCITMRTLVAVAFEGVNHVKGFVRSNIATYLGKTIFRCKTLEKL